MTPAMRSKNIDANNKKKTHERRPWYGDISQTIGEQKIKTRNDSNAIVVKPKTLLHKLWTTTKKPTTIS